MPESEDQDNESIEEEGPQTKEQILFLTVEEVNDLHEDGIRRYSPKESLAILDRGLLESALAAPQQT